MDTSTRIAESLRVLPPDLDALDSYLTNELDILLDLTFPPDLAVADEGLEAVAPAHRIFQRPTYDRERDLLLFGQRALRKITLKGQDANLDLEEVEGLEAVAMTVGRPALCIQYGSFPPFPSPWEELDEHRAAIERVCRSIGRIEIYGHPLFPYAGTGFLVADDILMTNRHVAKYFCQYEQEQWTFKTGITPYIDYVREKGNPQAAEFAIVDVIGTHREVDLALLKVARLSTQRAVAPEPLVIAAEVPMLQQQSRVYIIGYPMWNGEKDVSWIIKRIFEGPHGVKRLQPGEICALYPASRLLNHDCSTLTGNSGSCLIDLQTHKVIGLHVSGQPREKNEAVALWTLRSDPLLRKAGVHFE